MNTSLKPLAIEDVPSVLETLEAAYFDIPFENSDFQNKTFVIAGQHTPARAFRAVGLRMFAKIRAVKEYLIGQQRVDIDIEEKEERIADPATNKFDRRRLELDLITLREGRKWGEKLLNDALRELDCLHKEFIRLPKYTREQFELEEASHFQLRLTRQMQIGGGAAESLANMTEDSPQMDQRIERALAAIKNPDLLK